MVPAVNQTSGGTGTGGFSTTAMVVVGLLVIGTIITVVVVATSGGDDGPVALTTEVTTATTADTQPTEDTSPTDTEPDSGLEQELAFPNRIPRAIPMDPIEAIEILGGDQILAEDLYGSAVNYTGGWDGSMPGMPEIDMIGLGVFRGPQVDDDSLLPWWVAILFMLNGGFSAPDQQGAGTQLALAISEEGLIPASGPDGLGDPRYSRYVFLDPNLYSYGRDFTETRAGVGAVYERAAVLAHPIPVSCLTSVCSWDASNFYRQPDDDGPSANDPTSYQLLKLIMYKGLFVSPDELEELMADGEPLEVPNDYRRNFTPFSAGEMAQIFFNETAPLAHADLMNLSFDDERSSLVDFDDSAFDVYESYAFGSDYVDLSEGS